MRVWGILLTAFGATACERSPPVTTSDARQIAVIIIDASAPLPPSAIAICPDASKVWTGGFPDDAARYEATLRSWTPECRHAALAQECGDRGCSAIISDPIIATSADAPEKAAAIQYRHDSNVAALQRGRETWQRVKEIRTYALSIRSIPRGLDPMCMQRMRKDFDRVDSVRSDLDTNLARLPEGMSGLLSALASAKNCLSCDPTSGTCDDMKEPIDDDAENFRQEAKLIAADDRKLRTVTPRLAASP